VAGSGASYTVAVSGMSGPGTVVAGLPAGAAQDAAGNPSQASTSDDNTVTFQPTMNAPPTIAVVPQDSVCDPRSLTAQVRLAVTDAETPAGSLVVSALSSNQNLLPDGRILVQGTGTARTVSVLPVPGRTGTSTVTAEVSDGTSQTNLPITVSVDGSGPGNLAGTAGTDVLLGGLGADRLSGLAGPDLLCGGLGSDRLTGGPGPDRFSGGGGGGDTAVDLTPGDGDTQDGTIP
jgi:Ca2+-binding RTX toxin-like protein